MKARQHLPARVFLTLALMLASVSPSFADFVLDAACSSQIAEAFQRDLLDRFMDESGVKVNTAVFSSEVCLNRLRNGFCNLAGSTVRISQEDRDSGLIEIPVCQDPMVVIAHGSCGVTNLSLKQIRNVFSGHVTNWKEMGGEDLPVILVNPAKDTGAYKNFRDMAMGPFELRQDLTAGKAYTALTAVKYIPGSISFITNAIAAQHPDITVVHVNGTAPSDPSYPFRQTFYLVIKGEPDTMMKQVIQYLMSDKAKERMAQRGMTPLF